MSCFPQTEISHNRSIAKQTQSPILKPDLAATLSMTRNQAGVLPFLADQQQTFAPKIHDLASALYGLPYGSSAAFYHGLSSPGIDPAALYNSMNRADLKELPNAWRGPHPAFSPYDPAFASLFYAGGLSHLALSDGVRRKNATRETTSVLKRWLDNHKKNPYPTKGEKIYLALESKMTLTQVSTWFANARRRLKKENKMTWSPRHGADDRDSGEENPDHGFPISPREHEEGSTPGKSGSSPNQIQELRDIPITAGAELPYQQYQQQMLLRQFALLPPHLRTPEALKQVHEQMQLRSRWAATAVSESESRSSEQTRPFVSPPKTSPTIDSKLIPERRSSIGSPSTSSYDRSPSPFHRPSQSTWIPPTLSDHTAPFRKASSASEPLSDLAKQHDEKNGGERPRIRSSDDSVKSKPSIWSPASMVSSKESESKLSSVDSSSRSSSTSTSASSSLKSPLSSKFDALNKTTDSEAPIPDKASLSSPVDSVSFPLQASMAQAYFREYQQYQRQLATQHSLQNHQSLSPSMLLQINKNDSLIHNQLLEQLRKTQGFQQKFDSVGNGESDKDPQTRRSSSKEAEPLSYDAPMNLSKSVKSRDDILPLRVKEKELESRNESWSGSASPV